MPFWSSKTTVFEDQGRKFAKSALGTESEKNQLDFMVRSYHSSLQAYSEPRRLSAENYDFVEGNSWEEKLRNNLIKRGIPPLEIPIILPRVLSVLGQYFESRGRIIAIPTQNAGTDDADIGTRLLEAQDENNRRVVNSTRQNEIKKALADALIGEMGGWVECYQDVGVDPLGLQCAERVSPFYVFPDPAVDISLASIRGRFLIKTMFKPVEQILLYARRYSNRPNIEQEIKAITGQYTRTSWYTGLTDAWARIWGAKEELRGEMTHYKENMFRLIEMHERRIAEQAFIFNPYDGRLDGPFTKEYAMQQVAGNVDVNIWLRDHDEIWTSCSLGDWLLIEEYRRDIQNGMFPIIPLAGYSFSGKNFSPLVGPLKGLQKEKNQARTSYLTILRSNAFGGWIYEEGALSEEMEEKLELYGASANFNMKYKTGRPQPSRIAYQAISTGDIQRDTMTMQDVENVSAIGRGELGLQEPGGESGIKHRQKIIQAVKGLREIFNNATDCEINVCRYLLDMMQYYLQPDRVIEYAGKENKPEALIIGENLRLDLFRIKVIQGDDSDTARAQKLAEAQALIPLIPPDKYPLFLPFILRMLNWADSNEIIEALQLNNQIPLEFQARLLQTLQDVDQGYQPALQPGEETPAQQNLLPAGAMQQ